jgi:hypothetical protein
LALEFNKPVEWDGNFVALEDVTFKDTVTLKGQSGKDPIKDHESGGVLLQGIKKINKDLKITKMKFMLENIETMANSPVTINGGAVGTIKNCPDIKSLSCTENVELRMLRSKTKETLSVNTGRGELIDVESGGDATLTNSGFILRNNQYKKNLSLSESFILGNNQSITEDFSVAKSYVTLEVTDSKNLNLTDYSYFQNSKLINTETIDSLNSFLTLTGTATKKFTLTSSSLFGSIFNVSEDMTANDTVGITQVLLTNNLNILHSSLLSHSVSGNIMVDENSSFVGLSTLCGLSSAGSVLLTNSNASVNIINKGFIGIGVTGSSNLSSLQSGVDILASPRINNRTFDDFIAEAKGSVYLVAGSNLLTQAEGKIDSIASSSNLVKGSSVYCVGMCNFTPHDFCTAKDCKKPVWNAGGKGQSVQLPD